MTTKFSMIVDSSAQDFTTLDAALAICVASDITATSTVKTFNISAKTSPTIADGDAVTGLTSGATGTMGHVNVAGTQCLIRAISGTFQSGEVVKKTSDATKTVTLSNAGDAAIWSVNLNAFLDTTGSPNGGRTITTDASHYIEILANTGVQKPMPYSSSAYRLEVTNSTFGALRVNTGYIRITGLQIKSISTGSNAWICLDLRPPAAASDVRVNSCIVVGANATSTSSTAVGIQCTANNASHVFSIWNCVVYDCVQSGGTNGEGIGWNNAGTNSTGYIYDCTVVNCTIGYYSPNGAQAPSNVILKNCGYYSNGLSSADGFKTGTGSFSASSDYNASDIAADAPGTHAQNSVTPSFVDLSGRDLHLAGGDTVWGGKGTDLSGDSHIAISTDIDGNTRSAFDIGASITSGTTYAKTASDGTPVGDAVTITLSTPPTSSDGAVVGDTSSVASITVPDTGPEGFVFGDAAVASFVILQTPIKSGPGLTQRLLTRGDWLLNTQ